MSWVEPKRIDEYVLHYLKDGPVRALDLVCIIQKERAHTTKQAVYSAIRSLRVQEILLVVKGKVFLNIPWVHRMVGILDLAKKAYLGGGDRGTFLDLEDGEKIKWYFNDAQNGDIFWTQAYYVLLEKLPPGESIFFYNPHEWFLLARAENEKTLIRATTQRGHTLLITAGGDFFLDRYVRKFFGDERCQYKISKSSIAKSSAYYINVLGDFLIEAWLDKRVADQIETLYGEITVWNEAVARKFVDVLNMRGRMRIVISRNRKKAEKLKKTLRKDFVFRKKLMQ